MPDFTYEIEDIKLAQQGLERINWVRERMPVLRQIKQDFSRTRPFAGMRIGICLHVEAKTGVWLDALISGGKRVTVIGYGYCGQGIARALRGLGARVTIVDIDPLTRLEAHLEGYHTTELEQALPGSDIVITVTGRPGALKREHLTLMKDGAVLCNAGAFENEIDLPGLRELSSEPRQIMPDIQKFKLSNGKIIYLFGKGNSVNLTAADGNPIEVMDLGLALQSLSLAYLAADSQSLPAGPQTVPKEIENEVAVRTLQAWS